MSRLNLPRRSFLGTAAGAATVAAADMSFLNRLRGAEQAAALKKNDKRVILLWLAGGASQMETWDPKPGTPNGGPYRAIPTAVPGVHISELMPKMATRLKHTAIIRSLNTKIADHGGGAKMMQLGRRDEPAVRYPDLGAVVARELGRTESKVPDYVSFYSMTEGKGTGPGQSGFLGARYQAMYLTEKSAPDNLGRLETISDVDHKERADLRDLLSKRFAQGRETAAVGSHNQAYSRVRGLMASEELFDVERETPKMRERYGRTQFGEQTLIARRLVEAGVPFVKVGRGWWDSHGENFETHLELVTELDHVMSTLLDDLSDRGLLENTLVVTLSEFGRTPRINSSLGRDHFASAWSVTLSGCGVKGGACYGVTHEDGNTVKDGEIGAPALFATIYEALGIDITKEYHVGPRPIPIVDNYAGPVTEVLA